MGKAAKTRRSEARKGVKRARKAAEQARYESYKKAGSNRKKKRETAAGGVAKAKHAMTFCGNQGCQRCHPSLALQRMNDSNDPRVRFRTLKEVLAA